MSTAKRVGASTLPLLDQLRVQPQLPMIIATAAMVTAAAAFMLWGGKPDYKVLYSNVSDRDGGAIIASLQQMNVPYKFAEGGGAILVASDKVPEVRLRLATQGLPKGGGVSFELMDNQKFGTSQFAEQINYQRGLEGELARSIESIAEVETALAQANMMGVAALGHRAKSSARTVGAIGFADLCQALEQCKRAGDYDQACGIVAQMQPLLERIAEQINKELTA